MNLKDILAKKASELSAAEKTFLIAHKAELTTEQLSAFGTVFDEGGAAETEEQKKEREAKELGDKNEAAGLNRDGSPKVNASEKKNMVQISASELQALQDMANKGAAAFAELRSNAIKSDVAALTFSEANKDGRFLPKSADSLKSFMEGLTEAQRKSFKELIVALPKTNLFAETGNGSGSGLGTAAATLAAKVEVAMKADTKLKYSDAVRRVLSEDKQLAQQYAEETNPSNVA